MKRSGRLMEQVIARDNLRLAFWKAARGKRVKPDAAAFAARLDENLDALGRDLIEERYAVGPCHQFTIHDPKQRLITAPCFRDRVLHHALMNVCEPIFDRFLIDDTFACRCGKGRIAAVERAGEFARGHAFFLKLDIRKYFDSIAHSVLRERLEHRFKDRRLLDLFGRIIAGYQTVPGRGVPIGSLTSQHFANFYLGGLDRFVKESLRVKGYVRYMDDFVLWAEDRSDLRAGRDRIREFLDRELHLELKAEPYINRCRVGMDFLGCRVYPSHITLSRRSRIRFQRRLRRLQAERSRGSIHDEELQRRATALVSFTRAGPTVSWRWRDRVLRSSRVGGQGLAPGQPGR
ncbi:MAG: reverse transcriptase domain-containing protein [Isosphaeraceae bacterium]